MPKGSIELTEKRKNEIIDACLSTYSKYGFQNVNIKEISNALNITRPAIYHYFETKEEILLGLLIREYDDWLKKLRTFDCGRKANKESIAVSLATSLKDKDIMLRILNMNLFDIEINSRVERLAEFKKLYKEECELFIAILTAYNQKFSKEEGSIFCENFNAFLIGLYPFVHHTEKQIEAMRMVGIKHEEKSIYDIVFNYIIRNL